MTLSTNTAIQKLAGLTTEGALIQGIHREVIQSVGATRQLKANESGALCLFDRAAGNVYTLPTPVEGMWFEFLTTVAVTSNAQKVITKTTASEFMLGGVMIGSLTVAEAGDCFQANGSTHVAISSDGATKGGLIGGRFKLVAISTTQWVIDGVLIGAGTLADPFATS